MDAATMTVTPLGVGRAFARRLRNSNFVIEGAEGLRILLDCGFTAPAALDDLGLFESINVLLITHCHMDHIGGLEEFLLRRHLRGGPSPGLVAPDEVVEQLNTIFGPSLRWVGRQGPFDVVGRRRGTAHLLQHPMEPNGDYFLTRLAFNGVVYLIRAFATNHVWHMPTYGYQIVREGPDSRSAVLISGDTAEPISARDLAEDSDVVFHDVGDDPVHATVQSVADSFRGSRVVLYGYHYADDLGDAPFDLAREGVRFEVTPRKVVC
ncbi:MAG: ribonuclease Z [Armatimonadetes bacterium]|nr:ribonuclease Z [Armatimonadota bacterium]